MQTLLITLEADSLARLVQPVPWVGEWVGGGGGASRNGPARLSAAVGRTRSPGRASAHPDDPARGGLRRSGGSARRP